MKPITSVAAALVLAWTSSAYAINYFVDAVTGNDAWTGTAPTAPTAGTTGPWRTLGRVNSATLAAGDAVFFRCGQSWRGTLRTATSTNASSPIRYSRFGADCTDTNKPTITSAGAIAGWQPYAGNIWVATVFWPVYQLYADGVQLRLAQHPNLDYQAQSFARGMFVVDTSLPQPFTRTTIEDAELAAIGGQDLVGAGVHIRVNDFTINDRVVTAFDPGSNRLTLNQAASFSIRANWGYYLDNKLWMLDEPGEFYYDGSNPVQLKVYAWLPDSGDPGNRMVGATNAYAIDATGSQNVVIEALRLEKMGTGLAMNSTVNVVARSLDIADSYYNGIAAFSSTSGTIDNCVIRRSVREGINTGTSSFFQVLNNRVVDSGVIGSPLQSRGAISSNGTDNAFKGNHVLNSGYHGISFGKRSNVANNRVENACLMMSDCGGIYTGTGGDYTPHSSVVFGNIVTGVYGNRNGRDPASVQVITPGIYVDYRTNAMYVASNTVGNADMGIFLHATTNTQVLDNTFYDYDSTGIRIKEYAFVLITTPNSIQRNKFFGLKDSHAVNLLPATVNYSSLGAFAGNRYSAMYADNPTLPVVAKVTTYLNGRYQDQIFDYTQWQAAGQDLGGSLFDAVNIAPFAFQPVTGVNLLANGSFDTGLDGWRPYGPQGGVTALWSTSCVVPGCAFLDTGSASSYGSLVSSPFMPTPGKSYLVSFRHRAGVGMPVSFKVVPRRAGPNGFALLDERYEVLAGTDWRSQSVLFSVSPEEVFEPNDLGGRVDFVAGANQSLYLDSIRVEEATSTANNPADDAVLLINATSFNGTFSCPDAGAAPEKCAEYIFFDNEQPVTWPVTVPARRTTILVWTANPFRSP